MKYVLHFLLFLLFYFIVAIIVFAALPSTNITEYIRKEKTYPHMLSITLGVFYYFTVVVYEYIYVHIYLILLIYIYLLLLTASLSLSFSFFFSWSIWFKTIIFYSNVYLYGEREKEVVWSRSIDTIGRHHFRQH